MVGGATPRGESVTVDLELPQTVPLCVRHESLLCVAYGQPRETNPTRGVRPSALAAAMVSARVDAADAFASALLALPGPLPGREVSRISNIVHQKIAASRSRGGCVVCSGRSRGGRLQDSACSSARQGGSSRRVSGWSIATCSRVFAAPEGVRRPCSQSCRVRTLTPSSSAKSVCGRPTRLRASLICDACHRALCAVGAAFFMALQKSGVAGMRRPRGSGRRAVRAATANVELYGIAVGRSGTGTGSQSSGGL